jgi:hypothetical protein
LTGSIQFAKIDFFRPIHIFRHVAFCAGDFAMSAGQFKIGTVVIECYLLPAVFIVTGRAAVDIYNSGDTAHVRIGVAIKATGR